MTRYAGPDFIRSHTWRLLRRERLRLAGFRCECCGSTERLQLDHIRSRAEGNTGPVGLDGVQILCQRCNQSKGTMELTAEQLREQLGLIYGGGRPATAARPATIFRRK